MFLRRSTSLFGSRVATAGLRATTAIKQQGVVTWKNSNCSLRWMASLSTSTSSSPHQQSGGHGGSSDAGRTTTKVAAALLAAAVAAATAGVALVGDDLSSITTNNNSKYANCQRRMSTTTSSKPLPDEGHWTPVRVSNENIQDIVNGHPDVDTMPIYTSDQVADNNGEDGKPVWMSYGGVVYNVTDFVQNHPGGSNMIMQAAGSAIEPYWHIYRQHFASDLPTRLMEHMVIGRLADIDQDAIEEQMTVLQETGEDPYALEPLRHKALKVHADQPMNAECPAHILTHNYLTPRSLFYIRNHHPVPFLTDKEIKKFKLEIDLSAYGKGTMELSLAELRKMEKVEVIATLQCSGNRRSGFNRYLRTTGTNWGQGAISNAKWGGVRLSEVLKLAGVTDPIAAQEKDGMEHVRFHALDGMSASIGIEKALNPYGDCIICYEMNDQPLPRDHGFPLRMIVPGYAAVRNVKWLTKIELSKDEAEGPWQRGLNYKTLPPNVTDANQVNLREMPSVMEASIFSGITVLEPLESDALWPEPGDVIMMRVGGWAWAGGGRKIVRVDATGDNCKNWSSAEIVEGQNQKMGRAWAWTFWEAEVPSVVLEDGSVQVACKAVDSSLNVQPETCDNVWNIRGLGNNSWYRTSTKVR